MNCTYCAETISEPNWFLKTFDGIFPVCNAVCRDHLRLAWGYTAWDELWPSAASPMPVLPLSEAILDTYTSEDVSKDALEKTCLKGVFSCEKQDMPLSPTRQDASMDTLFIPLRADYSPFCPAVVPYSLARDFRLALGYASGAFLLALGSVALFHHFLF